MIYLQNITSKLVIRLAELPKPYDEDSWREVSRQEYEFVNHKDLQKVESSHVSRIGWNTNRISPIQFQHLPILVLGIVIEFKTISTYVYVDLTDGICRGLFEAESVGSYVNSVLKKSPTECYQIMNVNDELIYKSTKTQKLFRVTAIEEEPFYKLDEISITDL